jgi:hypothetical protein
VEIIKACLKLDNDKDHHTHGNTNCQAGNIDHRVISVTGQTPECGFKMILKHTFLISDA